MPGDVEVDDGASRPTGSRRANGRGIAVPGFVDLQVNGFGGVDFLDADAAATAPPATRCSRPASPRSCRRSSPRLRRSCSRRFARCRPARAAAHPRRPSRGPVPLAPPARNARAAARRDPDLELLERLLDGGPVRLMTLAPELPGAAALIDAPAASAASTVSLGHTDATAEQANAAFDLGVGTVTHLFNAMRPFMHRDPGIVGAALARDDVIVQVILDGIHLARETAQLVWRAAAGRVALVTDAIAGAGASDGSYSLGGLDVEVSDGVARGPGGRARRQLADDDRGGPEPPLARRPARRTPSARRPRCPARVLGARRRRPAEVGLPADIVVLDDNLELARVLVGGDALVVV